jgi:hypothetical protein
MTCSDVGDNVLDMSGRPGTSAVARKALPRDLMHLLPFLVVDDIRDLVIIDADELDRLTIEQLLMIAALADIRLTLVPAGPWDADVRAVLHSVAPTSSVQEVVADWDRRQGHRRDDRCIGRDAQSLGSTCPVHSDVRTCLGRHLAHHLQLGQLSPDAARQLLRQLTSASQLDTQVRHEIMLKHGRVTVVPAVQALRAAGLTATQQVAARLDNVSADARTVLDHQLVQVAAVRQQVLHSRVLGQSRLDHLLTLDGTTMRADTVARL